ncbi:MAG: acyclic terpene utilization AtuA family protein, partial [Vulcanimicrobiaceae bacterium]
MRELRAISPGKLGYGCDLPSIERALERDPHYIAIDAGTTDIGAYYLGTGEPFYAPSSIKRDLVPLMRAAHQRKIPLIVGNMVATARNDQLAFGMSIVREVAREEGLEFRVAVIPAEIDRAELQRRNNVQALEPLGARAPLTKADIEGSTAVIGQMGVEPIVRALDAGADMVVCGRACDDVLFAAVPVREGYDQGLALHMGKILECGAVAFEPGSLHASAIGYLRDDHFVLEAADPERKATVQSVASHTLYERSDPYLQAGPGGINDLSASRFEQLDERRVKISGSRWVTA